MRTGAIGCGRVQVRRVLQVGQVRQVRVRQVRHVLVVVAFALTTACARPEPPSGPVTVAAAPKDAQHAGITEPHGDHTPHQGGLVLMNGDVHYEVVMHPSGRYEVWFSDAVRTELPASVASGVRVQVTRPSQPDETVSLAIDDAGESWVGQGQPLSGEGVMVKVTYDLKGTPSEVEIPFVAPRN